MFLIRTPDGDTMLVDSLDGHADCTVLDSSAPAMTLADARIMKRAEIELYLSSQYLAGYIPTLAALAGYTLQLRDEKDRTNWLTSRALYEHQVNAGNGAAMGADIRTTQNVTVTVSYQDGFDTLMAMADWARAMMEKSWSLKDQVDALADADSVLAYDVAAQWAAL